MTVFEERVDSQSLTVLDRALQYTNLVQGHVVLTYSACAMKELERLSWNSDSGAQRICWNPMALPRNSRTAYRIQRFHYLRLLPTDGQEVDLQPLFFQITMDLSTELLFGKSSLLLTSQTNPSSPAAKFAEAFGNAQIRAALRLRTRRFAAIILQRKFKHNVQ